MANEASCKRGACLCLVLAAYFFYCDLWADASTARYGEQRIGYVIANTPTIQISTYVIDLVKPNKFNIHYTLHKN